MQAWTQALLTHEKTTPCYLRVGYLGISFTLKPNPQLIQNLVSGSRVLQLKTYKRNH